MELEKRGERAAFISLQWLDGELLLLLPTTTKPVMDE
jgi:hypothetical protein